MLRAKDDKERKAIINQIDKVYNSTEGITIKEACAAVGISDRTYYNWRNRLQQDSTKTVSEQVPTSSPNTARVYFSTNCSFIYCASI
jgi:transposase-like protein